MAPHLTPHPTSPTQHPNPTPPTPDTAHTPPAPAPPALLTTPTAEHLATAFLLAHHGNTRAAYTADLRHYATWCATHHLDPLTARRAHIDAYTETLRRTGTAPATIVRRLAALTGFYTYAVDEGALTTNPAARARRPRVGDNTQSTGLSHTEAHTLLTAADADTPRTRLIVTVLLLTGLRVSELTAANADDLATERGHRTLTVTRKGGHRQRMVLPPRAADAVDTYLDGRTHGPLLLTHRGNRLDRTAVWRTLRRLATTALPHRAHTLHPHDLRHACATLALDAGASLRDVQDLLGHADTRTTRRYDRARHNLDRSPSYALAGLLATPGTTPATTTPPTNDIPR